MDEREVVQVRGEGKVEESERREIRGDGERERERERENENNSCKESERLCFFSYSILLPSSLFLDHSSSPSPPSSSSSSHSSFQSRPNNPYLLPLNEPPA